MINKRHISLLIISLSFCAVTFSCRVKKGSSLSEPQEQCAFYTIKFVRDSVLNKTYAEITKVNVVNTKVRYVLDETKIHEPYFLKIEITYANRKVVHAFSEHPLYKRLDLYSESGKIESKLISLSQGEVFLRVPYFGNYKKIVITETVNFKELTSIILRNEK